MAIHTINIEIHAQHWPDRLHKPRTGSVRPGSMRNRKAVEQIFREGIYLGVSVGVHL